MHAERTYNNQKIITALFCVLGTLLAVIPFLRTSFFYFSEISTRLIGWAIIVLLAFVCLGFILKNKTARHELCVRVQDPIVWMFGVFVVWVTARTTAGAWDMISWWGEWLRGDGLWMHWSWVAVLVVVCVLAETHKKIFRYVCALFVCVTLVTTYAVAYFPALNNYLASSGVRWASTVGNAVYLAGLLIFIPWAAREAVAQRAMNVAHKKIFFTFIFLLTFFALVQTGVRGAMIGVVCGCVVYGIERFRTSHRMYAYGVAACVLVVFGVGMWFAPTRAFNFTKDSSTQARVLLIKNGLHEFAHHPFVGYGFGEHEKAIERNIIAFDQIGSDEFIFDSTHSAYLDMALYGGGIAVVLFVAWLVIVYRRMGTAYDDPTDRALARATLVAYAVFLVTIFFEPWSALPLMLLVVASTRSYHAQKMKNEKRTTCSRAVCMTGFFIFCAVSGISACILLVTLPRVAYAYAEVARVVNARAPSAAFVSAARETNHWFPFQKDGVMQLARWGILYASDQNSLLDEGFREVIADRVANLASHTGLLARDDHALSVFAIAYATHPANQTDRARWLQLAEAWERTALQTSPDRVQSVIQLADVLREDGRPDEALATLDGERTRHPESATAQLYYAVLADILGHTKEAASSAEHAFALRSLNDWGADKTPDLTAWFTDLESRAHQK